MISPETWGVLGDVARNTSGLLAVCAAYFTIRVAYRTNQARAREAVRTHFRDRIQWAVEHVDSDKELERTLAQQVILKYYSDSELEVDDLKIATVVAEEYLSGKEDATDSSYVEESAYLENELEHPDNRTILDLLEEGEE
ncbi:hypothetical protein D8M23_07830 [Rothia sp. HSID18067]|jgi:hypothetical protein|uniref:hypothetical protein n=1 Tax=Rothia TaxID=32207 RepID=UPI000F88B669|nr:MULTISPECIES: hypothetical protein [Rothia]RUP72583.1 hypothetical protein D8M23_07830 [Rothia sp. HSID18067]